MMAGMRKTLFLLLLLLCFAMTASGCCNTQFKLKQLGDDMHAYFLDGDSELLSEAEPDNGI